MVAAVAAAVVGVSAFSLYRGRDASVSGSILTSWGVGFSIAKNKRGEGDVESE